MILFRRKAFARAGLVGNPSDGYHGRTISLLVRNFWAEVTLYEWEDLEIVSTNEDRSRFQSVDDLVRDVKLHGYYGGIRLIKATIKKFVEYCHRRGLPLHDRNFSVRYQSNIPRQVGMAGSSAIIVATLRALMDFYGVEIPREVQPSLVLSVESEELNIAAGLQDRVIQVYEGLVYMDFSREQMRSIQGYQCGVYEPLDIGLLPPVYVAFSADVSEPTEVVHNNLRARYQQGEQKVHDAMRELAELTRQAREAILGGDAQQFGACIDRNFELRRSIMNIAREHEQMVEFARAMGATASFAGSGGAIVGTFPDAATYARLEKTLGAIGCRVIRPLLG
ncbi:MAG: hypothetical protein KJZ87_09240 [Thermoguttaceae bacterium]|nr:hypothetical protein [Thermoguttaceae bacterium]